MNRKWDAFISYNRIDAAVAATLRVRLGQAQLEAFVDRYSLPAGQAWQPQLEGAIRSSRAMVVLVGAAGLGSWQLREIQLGLERQMLQGKANASFPVIPVILPGVRDDAIPLGTFLNQNTWVDLRSGIDSPEELHRLIAGINSKPISTQIASLAGLRPYRGLLPFREEDAGLFFGRERFVEELFRKVKQASSANVVGVLGRSGSGKSSTVYAGLFPVLRKERGLSDQDIWDLLALRPTADPLHAIVELFDRPAPTDGETIYIDTLKRRAQLLRDGRVTVSDYVSRRLKRLIGTTRCLLYVDQWEELYTQAQPRGIHTEDDRERASDVRLFIDLILDAARNTPCTVVLSVRSDFYPDIQTHDRLRALVQDSQVSLGPMTATELVAAIEKPALAIGGSVDRELTARLLRDIGMDTDAHAHEYYDIGKLPLLEYALEQAWITSKDGQLHLGDYAGLEQALEERANAIYSRLPRDQQVAAKRLFVSLVTPGEGREDTRAKISLPADPHFVAVVNAFAASDARLVVTGDASTGGRSVEVSHEALIRHWRELRRWVDENREQLRVRANLLSERQEWLGEHRRPDLLVPPGARLEAARQLLESPGDVVVGDVEDYINASIEAEEVRAAAESERQRLEVQRIRRHRRVLLAGSGALLLLSLGLAVVYARSQYHLSLALLTEAENLIEARRHTQAFVVADRAPIARLDRVLPWLGKDWAETAVRLRTITELTSPTVQAPTWTAKLPLAVTTVITSKGRIYIGLADGSVSLFKPPPIASAQTIVRHQSGISNLGTLFDGSVLVSASWSEIRFTELSPSWHERQSFSVKGLTALFVNTRKDMVAWGDSAGDVSVFHAQSDLIIPLASRGGMVTGVAINAAGDEVASVDSRGTIVRQDARSGHEIARYEAGRSDVWHIDYDPLNEFILSVSVSGAVQVWPIGKAGTGEEGWKIPLAEGQRTKIAWAKNGELLVVPSWTGLIEILRRSDFSYLGGFDGHDQRINDLVFDETESALYAGDQSGRLRRWDVARVTSPFDDVPVNEGATTIVGAYSKDGHFFATGSSDGRVALYRVDHNGSMSIHCAFRMENWVFGLAFSPDDSVLAAVRLAEEEIPTDNVVSFVSTSNCGITESFEASLRSYFHAIAFNPINGTAVLGDGVGNLYALAPRNGSMERLAQIHTTEVNEIAFFPDGSRFVSGSSDGTVAVWNADGDLLGTVKGPGGPLTTVDVSADGKYIAAGGIDPEIWVWSVGTQIMRIATLAIPGGTNRLAFDSDGTRLAAGSDDLYVAVWEVPSWRKIVHFDLGVGERSVYGFNPKNGDLAIDARNGVVRILPKSSKGRSIDRPGRIVGVDVLFDGHEEEFVVWPGGKS